MFIYRHFIYVYMFIMIVDVWGTKYTKANIGIMFPSKNNTPISIVFHLKKIWFSKILS